jgi:hypothetical protein
VAKDLAMKRELSPAGADVCLRTRSAGPPAVDPLAGSLPRPPSTLDPIDDARRALDELEMTRPSTRPAVVKRCACGRAFELSAWCALPLVGTHRDEVDRKEDLELRSCPCGSTIAVNLALAGLPTMMPVRE